VWLSKNDKDSYGEQKYAVFSGVSDVMMLFRNTIVFSDEHFLIESRT